MVQFMFVSPFSISIYVCLYSVNFFLISVMVQFLMNLCWIFMPTIC